jgi:uncharacterized delta-60 repeat protein
MGLAVGLLVQSASPVAASAGELDDTFDGNGKLTLNVSSEFDELYEVAIQPGDQKIVAVGVSHPGDSEWIVIRLNPDGSLDSTFGGGDGIVTIDFSSGEDYANAVALQADGKIVAVGLAGGSGGRWGIVRLDTDGSLDSSFSGDGKAVRDFTSGQDVANDVAIQADQKIVISGYTGAADSRFTVARFTTGGSLDSSFSGDGIATANLTSGRDLSYGVGVDSNGKIAVGGYASGSGGQVGVARFRAGGSLDPSFSGNGWLTTNITSQFDIVFGLAVQPDDKIVVAGYSGNANTKMLALRYNTDGTPDGSFSGNGNVTVDIDTELVDAAYSVALQDDGKIVLAGTHNFAFFAVVRLTSTGTLDSDFADDGLALANITTGFDVAYHVAIQADGAILAVGGSSGQGGRLSAARFLGT